eukprot:gene2612-530_t
MSSALPVSPPGSMPDAATKYFTGTLLIMCIPLHPVHYMFANVHAQPCADHPTPSNTWGRPSCRLPQGFGGSYFHYLHHAKYSVNFGTPFLPLDLLTGTWCAGPSLKNTYKFKFNSWGNWVFERSM